MKIGYYLINSPLKYKVSYLNGNLDYTPCDHKLVTLFDGHEIKLSVPVDDGSARGFDYNLKVTNIIDKIVLNNNIYNISVKQLYSTYQNHVLHNASYWSFWTQAMNKTKDIKNDEGIYKTTWAGLLIQQRILHWWNPASVCGCWLWCRKSYWSQDHTTQLLVKQTAPSRVSLPPCGSFLSKGTWVPQWRSRRSLPWWHWYLMPKISTWHDTDLPWSDQFGWAWHFWHQLWSKTHPQPANPLCFQKLESAKIMVCKMPLFSKRQEISKKVCCQTVEKLKLPNYSFDFVDDINNRIRNNPQDSKAFLDVQKNNWLHPQKWPVFQTPWQTYWCSFFTGPNFINKQSFPYHYQN